MTKITVWRLIEESVIEYKMFGAAFCSDDVEDKITYFQLLNELCRKSADGHATALTICDQLKVYIVNELHCKMM